VLEMQRTIAFVFLSNPPHTTQKETDSPRLFIAIQHLESGAVAVCFAVVAVANTITKVKTDDIPIELIAPPEEFFAPL
jgi:hypothetical protein